MADETKDAEISFKIKTSSGGESNHTITMPETKTVLDLKELLAAKEYEDTPVDRQRLIYSGRVMKNEEPLSTYKIKSGNTIHMVKSAKSNAAQNPANSGTASAASGGSAAGVPTNMAAGTANNPLAGLTGARYAGHVQLPGMDMFGPDAGMGAPPDEDAIADQMMNNPNMAQMMNEALQNPAMIDMMIQSNPQLRAMGPEARQMLQSPMFRQMMTDPNMLRQAAQMRRMMNPGQGGGSFPAPGVTDTTPEGAASSAPGAGGAANAANPFASLFGQGGGGQLGAPFARYGQPGAGGFPFGAAPAGQTPAASPPTSASVGGTPAGSGTPSGDASRNPQAANPFASLIPGFGAGAGAGAGAGLGAGGGGLFGMSPEQMQQTARSMGLPDMTPEQMQQAMQMAQQMGMGPGTGAGGFGGFGGFPGLGGAASPPPPSAADSRPPEELYADQLRALNDMGFFDFNANVQALRRSGGSVEGAVNSLLGG